MFSVLSLHAQRIEGGLRGKISDVDFSEPIRGAQVIVEETGAVGVTDDQGNFSILGLSPGVYTISASREGFGRQRVERILVTGGSVKQADVRLTAEVVELEDFVVEESSLVAEGSTVQALDTQRNLDAFATVLGAEFISKIVGGGDIGRALTKSAGVSVQGGGKEVVVRGLADRYNVVLVNGAYVPSSDPDRRSVNIDLFPASIVSNLQTTKTFTADLPGEATGGAINLITKGIPDKNFIIVKPGIGYDSIATGNSRFLSYNGGGTGVLGLSNERRIPDALRNASDQKFAENGAASSEFQQEIYRSLPKTMGTSAKTAPPNFTFEGTMAARGSFGLAPVGGLIAVNYGKSYRYDPDGFTGRYTFGRDGEVSSSQRAFFVDRGIESLRASVFATAGIQPASGHEIKATLLANVVADDRATFQAGLANGDVGARESIAYTERRLKVAQLNGTHAFDSPMDFKLDWTASYNLSSQDEPDHRFVQSDRLFVQPGTEVRPRPEDILQYEAGGSQSIPQFRRYFRTLDDTRWNIAANVDGRIFATDSLRQEARFKAGFTFDYATRNYRADSFAYNPGTNGIFPNESKPRQFPEESIGDSFLYRNTENPTLSRFTPVEFYDASQFIPAGYVQVKFDLAESLHLTMGVRAEFTHIRIRGSKIEDIQDEGIALQFFNDEERPLVIEDLFNGDPAAAANNSIIQAKNRVDLNEDQVLPMFSAKYDIRSDMSVRLAFSRTVARPSFKEMAPVLLRDAETGDNFIGNPDLKVSHITNYDIRWEWFPAAGGNVSISGFAKEIEDPIEKSFESTQKFVNSNTASLFGFELEADRNLAFINENLREFSIGINYTYLQSKVERESATVFNLTRRLQGQPDYLFNFNLTYDNKDLGLYAGLFLNVTGAYLDSVGGGAVPDVFVDPMASLNLVFQYQLGPMGKLTLRANNLNTPVVRKVYDNGGRDLFSLEQIPATYSLSYEIQF